MAYALAAGVNPAVSPNAMPEDVLIAFGMLIVCYALGWISCVLIMGWTR